jgi:hypothetical protein
MSGELFYGKSRDDWIHELERELAIRARFYTRAVRERRMNARQAAWQIDTLQDLLNHLKENPTWQPKSSSGPPTSDATG